MDNCLISVLDKSPTFRIRKKIVAKVCREIAGALGVEDYGLSVQFVGVQKMRGINYRFRRKNYNTDVLSFPQTIWKKAVTVGRSPREKTPASFRLLGDIIISLAKARENSISIGHPIDRETAFLLTHGILHLCGHDHMNSREEKIMLEQQKKIMKKITGTSGQKPTWQGCVRVIAPRRRVGH